MNGRKIPEAKPETTGRSVCSISVFSISVFDFKYGKIIPLAGMMVHQFLATWD